MMSNIIALFIFSLLICLLITYYSISVFTYFGIVDRPSARRAHSKVTPRCGGVSIVLTFCLGLAVSDKIEHNSFLLSFGIIVPILVVAFISFLDDIWDISILLRLITHIIASGVVLYLFVYPRTLFYNELPEWLDYVLSLFLLTTFINIYNFMDGIDGITSVESIHLSATIIILSLLRYDTILHVNLILIMATLVLGCSIAFIYYNWSPSKIFLGDVGTISLGLIIGLCLVLIAVSEPKLFVASFIACLYYIADGVGTILIRITKLEKIWLPHLNHFFQKAVRKNMSHREVATKIAICNFVLMLLSIAALYYPILAIGIAIICVTILLIHFSL